MEAVNRDVDFVLPEVVIAIISGRPINDLQSRMLLGADTFYIGLHGLEIAGPHVAWNCDAAMDSYPDRMRDVAIRLQDTISRIPGVRLECKGPIVALHTREASAEDVVWSRFQLLSAEADLVNADVVGGLRGNDVLELVPNVGCTRADAVRTVKRCVEERHHRPVSTVYIAEDAPDDDAVAAVGQNSVAAVVGRRRSGSYHFDSPDEVDSLIEELISARPSTPTG